MFDTPALRWMRDTLDQAPSHSPFDDTVRQYVQMRARDACEYCLMPALSQFHVDHIVPHSRWRQYLTGSLLMEPRGSDREVDHIDNFAWACAYCNTFKVNRISARVGRSSHRLFHPRRDLWVEHFVLTEDFVLILGLTDIGKATVRALGFNDGRPNGPMTSRHKAVIVGIYPPVWARGWGH
jgi:hypothetical protein